MHAIETSPVQSLNRIYGYVKKRRQFAENFIEKFFIEKFSSKKLVEICPRGPTCTYFIRFKYSPRVLGLHVFV